MPDKITLSVQAHDNHQRVDKFISHYTDFSRHRVQHLIKQGAVSCDNKAVTQTSVKVKPGQTYCIVVPEVQSVDILPEPIALDIIFEDAHLLVINKPAGMVVHPAAGHYSATLVNALMYHCKESLSGIGGQARPGIVHRLDKDTSGLMMVAKTDQAHHHLSAQLQDRSLSRTYHAYLWGAVQPMHGTIDAPIARSPKDRKKMAVVEGGKQAVTHYRTLQQFAHGSVFASHVECVLQTGRTHQIRVHMAHKRSALIGDKDYGYHARKKATGYALPECDALDYITAFNRQALHAHHIKFIHPATDKPMEFLCNIPQDMQRLDIALQTLAHS